MLKLDLLGASALRTAAFGFVVAIATPSFAQQVPADTDPPSTLQSEQEIESGDNATDSSNDAAAGEAIVVTGSRIRRPNLESTVPVTSVGGEEFFQTGNLSVGDTLAELPSVRSTLTQSNSTQFLGTAGLNLVDLRGLGPQRTLVLVNGRRHVAGDILFTAASVDTNTIPTDLIERVDVVTGGNSAIYGSDAIAGVVNFVLKQDYQGLQIRGQAGISTYGDAGNHYISALAGTNFADGRGNIAVNVEYAHQDDYYASDRPYFAQGPNANVQVDRDDPANPDDGDPDRRFFKHVHSSTYSNGGSFWACCTVLDPDGPNVGGTGVFTTPYLFQPDGTLIQQTGTRVGVDPFGSFIDGNGSTFYEGTQVGLSPRLDRFSANLIAHFDVSDAFVPFVEATYSKTRSLGNSSGPYFTNAIGNPREVFFTDNPYLNPQAANFIRDYYGVAPGGETSFLMYRNVVELNNREEKGTRETYRIVGGVRGSFNDDWSYEISANYGHFKETTQLTGNVNLQRYLLSIDAVRDPSSGNIVCRASIDPAARIAYEFALDPAYAQSQLANDVASCVPVNLFGEGNITQAAKDYITQDANMYGTLSEFVLNGFMSGDTSEFLNLPGGPIGFAIGGEYRRENAFYHQDELVSSGLTFYNAIPDLNPPKPLTVKELFGEIRLPILKDTPFFQELTLSAAGRISNYNGATGTVYAYNGGIDWAPIRDIRFRANYARAVRAPNLSDLYTPLGTNFAPGFQDPCALTQLGGGSATRAANCSADGVPGGFNFTYSDSLEFKSGGNPNLKEETSDSYTVGAVIQPRFIPGFALTVDYYDITVNGVITSPSAQQLVDACYDASDLNNQFCDQFERNTGPGLGPRGELPGQILEANLRLTPLNYAKLKVRGIDVEASYRHSLGTIGMLSTKVIYTHALQNDAFLDPTDPGTADQTLNEVGDPKDVFNWNVDLKHGPFTIGYQMRYIGKQLVTNADYENFFSKQGRAPQDADYSEVVWFGDVFYHDVRLSFDAGDKFNFYVGVDDIGDRQPPHNSPAVGGNTLGDTGIYRNIGRFFYAGAVAKF